MVKVARRGRTVTIRFPMMASPLFRHFDNYRIDGVGGEKDSEIRQIFCGQGGAELDEVRFDAAEVSAQGGCFELVMHELTVARGANEACGFEFFHVVRERRGGDVDAVAHVGAGSGAGLAAELFQDFVAPRVSEGLRNEQELIFGKVGGLFCGFGEESHVN